MSTVTSELTGSVWKIVVDDQAEVAAGQQIMILESMKMEFEMNAPAAGTVSLKVAEGQAVSEGDPLFEVG